MGLHKDRHGTYYARVKVPKALQEAVAQALANGKARQVFLKRSLGTKSLHTANVRVKPVLVRRVSKVHRGPADGVAVVTDLVAR